MKLSIFFIIYLIFNNSYAQELDVYYKALLLKTDVKNGKKHYALCASCHLDNGAGKVNGSFPVVAGQHKSVIIKQLKDIQNKLRHNPTMFAFSDPQTIGGAQIMADVAAYIASLSVDFDNGIGAGNDLDKGKKLYQKNCISCHGENGSGNAERVFPRISPQHYKYLLRQLKWMRDEYRINTNSVMLALIKKMTDEDLTALADYISRL